MAQKIQIKRGLKANLSALDSGEYGFCTDTKEIFIGSSTGNLLVANSQIIGEIVNARGAFLSLKDRLDSFVSSVNGTTPDVNGNVTISVSGGSTVAHSSTNGNVLVDGSEVNVYTHPANHPASMTTEDATHRFVTDDEKVAWNAKADASSVYTKAEVYDKEEVDTRIATASSGGSVDLSNYYTKTQVDTNLDVKVDKITGKQLSTEDYTTLEKTKLSGISTGANTTSSSTTNGSINIDGIETSVYTHPASHPASMVEEDFNHQFVTTTDKTNWDAKASTSIATTSLNGLMSSGDKTKLDGVATGANNYVHPANHPASIITQDATNRFVSDTEKTTWNGKAPTTVVTTTVNGLMDFNDKVKLNGIATGANNYVHPSTHPPSIITQDATNRFVTDTEKTTWNGKAPTTVVTTTVNGLMDFNDKVKLNGIATSANNYVHPTGDGNSHVPATSTTNNAKVLKAGATANSAAWGNVDWAELSNKPSTFTPPIATSSALGGVKIGAGISVDVNGVISASGGASASNPVAVYVDDYTGTTDQKIQSAIDAATVNGAKKTVILGDKDYYITTSITIKKNVKLQGSQGSSIVIGANVRGLTLEQGASLEDCNINIDVAGYNKEVIYLDGSQKFYNTWHRANVRNVAIVNWTGTIGGTGIMLYSGLTDDEISFVQFDNIKVVSCTYGIRLQSASPASGMAYVNANRFTNISLEDCVHMISIEGSETIPYECSGNMFEHLQIQASSNTLDILSITGQYNRFDGMMWDISNITSTTSKIITFQTTSDYNYVNMRSVPATRTQNLGGTRNKYEIIGTVIEVRTTDPTTPEVGRMWLRSDL